MEKRTWSSNAGFPVGMRFQPTDKELILDYLLHKVNNNPLPYPIPVIDCDVYGDGIAWRRLFEENEEHSLYFFTILKKKTEKGQRVDRVTDCGTWKGQQRGKHIFSHGHQRVHIGSKRSFSFIPKKGFSENRGKWLMHEYRLDGCLFDNNTFYVICRIINKKSRRRVDDDGHLDVDVNRGAICVPNDVQDHHFDHVNHVFDNYVGGDGFNVIAHGDGSKECLNVSDCVAGNGVGEYLNACNCMGGDGTRECLNASDCVVGNAVGEYLNASNCMGGDGTRECLNGGDGLNASNYMMGGDDTMGGDGTRNCLNVSNYVGSDGLNCSNYMGGDGFGECLNRGDGLNVSNYLEDNGFGGYMNTSYYKEGENTGECWKVFDCVGDDGTRKCFNGCDGLSVSSYMGGDDFGECLNGGDGLNVSNYMGGNGFGGYLNTSYYMGGEGTGECWKVSDCVGGDGTRECFNGCDGFSVSTYMGGDGNGECLNISNDYMEKDALNVISDYLDSYDVGKHFNIFYCIEGDGVGKCVKDSDYMEEWFSLLSDDNNHHP